MDDALAGFAQAAITTEQTWAACFISRRTASHHVSAIMTRLGASPRGEAAVRAARAGLL